MVRFGLKEMVPRQFTPPTKNGPHGSRLFHQWPQRSAVATIGIQGAPTIEPRFKRYAPGTLLDLCNSVHPKTPEQDRACFCTSPKKVFSCSCNWLTDCSGKVISARSKKKGSIIIKMERGHYWPRDYWSETALTVSLFCKARAWSCCRARFTLEIAVKPACLFFLAARKLWVKGDAPELALQEFE